MDPQTLIDNILTRDEDPTPSERKAYNEWIAAGGFPARVQTHPATDSWMFGDKYGEVTKILLNGNFRFTSDRTGQSRTYIRENLIPIN